MKTLTIERELVRQIRGAVTNELKISAESRGATIATCRSDGSCSTVNLTSVVRYTGRSNYSMIDRDAAHAAEGD
jgi:hypothetical protein